ncbi:ImmA/IrrE family metallo-endopeptidase [Streptococcus jiangjianxini]|uniref:ImmA/IrrE family metallo-endopeptidase n=1 Tax=Streptococcus jiangjianxini TaxID=3161189 RepID=UPI0032ED55C9
MKINKLLEEYKVTLFLFHAEMWDRNGLYFPDLRTIYVNATLSEAEREKVILHELGHINHDPKHYSRLLLKYENQADRFMIRELIKDYLKDNDVYDFNWLQFANSYQISTTWGQDIIIEEFGNIVGE